MTQGTPLHGIAKLLMQQYGREARLTDASFLAAGTAAGVSEDQGEQFFRSL
ncbi:MAG: hypothetical protein IT448_00535 [Phycisphaerales bacterium]|nr:hypothetical protein [Phycisphaerales bacterium]